MIHPTLQKIMGVWDSALSRVFIPHRWEWSHLYLAKGLTVMPICQVILVTDQEVTLGDTQVFREKLQDVDV